MNSPQSMPLIRTPDQRLRVFVSSTLQELATERAAAREAIVHLHLTPVMFELGARPHPPQDLYRAYLAQSHVFIGLYWQRYGWVAPDMEISGLEDEWQLAAEHPKLVYIKNPAPQREAALDALLERIRDEGSTSYRTFSDAAELRELIEDDLAIMLTERFEATMLAGTRLETPERARARISIPDDDLAPIEAADTIPFPPTPLVGRDVEMAAITDLLDQPAVRLVTITGPGGSGKTRLAVELGHRFRDLHRAPVSFVDLTGLRSAALVLPTIAANLGIRDAGARPLIDAIRTVLDDDHRLLVIDNFEHVMDAAPSISQILAATRDVDMIVTSRQPLHLQWEHEYPLLPLDVPSDENLNVDAVATVSGVELLVQRARRVRPHFALDATNAGAVAEIVRRLDGLPLALELAAARLRVLIPTDLLDRLDNRLDGLGDASPDAPERHRTLREAIAWSHGLLDEREQCLFRRMGVFAAGASLDAVEAVCSSDELDSLAVLDVLAGLVDKSLVTSTGDAATGHSRFVLLETIREFAVEQLVASGEAETIWDRHLQWCAELAERSWLGFSGPDVAAWFEVLERELDNIRTALDHAAGAGDSGLGLRIATRLWPFWDVRGRMREGAERLRELLATSTPEASSTRGAALCSLAWQIALLGDFDEAMRLMDQGLPMVRAGDDELELGWTLAQIGNVAFSLGMADRAEELFSEGLSIARRNEAVFLEGWNLFGLSYVAFLRGDIEQMRHLLEQSLQLSRQIFQPWGMAWAQFSLAVLYLFEDEAPQAVGPLLESLSLRWSLRDTRGLAESLGLLASIAGPQGHDELAVKMHGAAEIQREANGMTVLPFLRPLFEESLPPLRNSLGDANFDRLWREGRSTPLEKLVQEVLGTEW
jgi:predicted ATPase